MPKIDVTSVTEGVWTCLFSSSDQESMQDPSTDTYPKLRVL